MVTLFVFFCIFVVAACSSLLIMCLFVFVVCCCIFAAAVVCAIVCFSAFARCHVVHKLSRCLLSLLRFVVLGV